MSHDTSYANTTRDADPTREGNDQGLGDLAPRADELLAELRDEERTRCEIWTRVMGYHRPVSAFNPGKKSEHAERKLFLEDRLYGVSISRARVRG